MNDTVKLIIEIPKEKYEHIKAFSDVVPDTYSSLVKNGIPLDDIDSDETRAYFDGQAYGWEQGRKALIDDVKTEMEKHQFSREYCCDHNIDTAIDMGMVRIILGNIGKGDKE